MEEKNFIVECRFLRLSDVLCIIPISKSSWWAGVKTGKYPRGYKLGRSTLWRVKDIVALIEKIESGEPISDRESAV